MADFGSYGGGSDEEFAVVRKHDAEVQANPDVFEHWESLIKAVESLEGGLNRNSSPQALATFRDAYDRFLAKFPLFFGYWKKYAEAEFNIAGPESAEMVYERGVANITNSTDLWTEYCSFKMETTHDPALVRDLFERGLSFVGNDFLSHLFWDKYIEYEERQESQDRVFQLLNRVMRLPTHQYARYFERFRQMSHSLPLTEVASAETVSRLRAEVEAEHAAQGTGPRPELEIERDVRAKLDSTNYDVFQHVASEVNKRWTWESEIRRPFFHTTEVDHAQLENWRKYLDFEEGEGDYHRIVSLYERCLSTFALYEEFWFRYIRWMSAQAGKQEDVRNIYMRAAFFVPISRPGLRLQWALFEERHCRVDIASDIHEAILQKLPDCVEVIVSWANMQRRQRGIDEAITVFNNYIEAPTVDLFTKAALIAETATFVWRAKGAVGEARALFLKNVQWYADSRVFWEKWFKFETEQPAYGKAKTQQSKHVRRVFDELRGRSRLSTGVKQELTKVYMDWLADLGGKTAMRTFLEVDCDMFGPASVAVLSKSTDTIKQNGLPTGQLEEADKQKAEATFARFYELHGEPNSAAQGNASFD